MSKCSGTWGVDRKKLADGGSGTSVEQCGDLALADPECGTLVYSDGDACRCVFPGVPCDYVDSAGATVYEYKEAAPPNLGVLTKQSASLGGKPPRRTFPPMHCACRFFW